MRGKGDGIDPERAKADLKLNYAYDSAGVDERLPLIYLWVIRDASGAVTYSYVGKSVNGSHRPRTAYRLNVNRLLANKPYRKGKPDGFRRVHHQLADAVRRGDDIALSLLANVQPDEDIFERERYWQGQHAVNPKDGAIDADSLEQRVAEVAILHELGSLIGTSLAPTTRSGMSFDGLSEDPPTLVEIWSHQGPPKPAQKYKVTADALKLIWGNESIFAGKGRMILALADREAAAPFQSGTWMSQAFDGFGIEVVVVGLPADVLARLRDAQRRQARGNR